MLQNLLEVVDSTEAGCLRTECGAAEQRVLTGESTVCIGGSQSSPSAEHVADLTAADTEVACRAVDIRSDEAEQAFHEGTAESLNLGIALAVRIEVGTTLSAADRKRGERILKGLLKAEELDDGKVYVRSETKAALVGSDHARELDAVAAVHVHVALVILPRNTEHDDTLRLDHSLENSVLLIFRMCVDQRAQRRENLLNRLAELRLVRVLCLNLSNDSLNVRIQLAHVTFLLQKIR